MKIDFPDKLFGVEVSLIKIFWPAVAILLLMAFSLKLVILPKISDLMKMNSQVKNIEKQVKLTQSKINYLAALDKNELSKNAGFLSNALLIEKDTYLLVRIVRIIAENYGFNVKSFLVAPGELKKSDEVKKTVTDPLTKIPVSMVVVGPKGRYLEFISGLEKSLPVLVLDNFELKSEGDMAELSLKVSSFYIGEKVVVDLNKVSLADLTLNKDESDVLMGLSQFVFDKRVSEIQAASGVKREAVKYVRENPFTP